MSLSSRHVFFSSRRDLKTEDSRPQLQQPTSTRRRTRLGLAQIRAQGTILLRPVCY